MNDRCQSLAYLNSQTGKQEQINSRQLNDLLVCSFFFVIGIFKPHDWCIFIHIFNQPFVVVISNSSSTLFVMLKFTCEGLHLKKLVDAIGAGNIVKAGTWKLYHLGLNFAMKEKIWYRERKRSSFSVS